jgi:hypothetical protein
VTRTLDTDPSLHGRPGAYYARPLWQLLKLVTAALLAYAIWRGYQNPDLLLDFATLRLC